MATLQARLARGEPAAFAELYDACADRVGHYLLVRLGSWADADDALQETFLRLARTREKLAEVDNLEAYVITIARNEAARLAAGQGKTRAEARTARRREALSVRPRRCRCAGERRDRGGRFGAIGAGLAGSRGIEDFFGPHVSADQPSDRAAARDGGHPLSLGLGKNASLVCEATAMNDDVEQRLSRLTPRGVRPELRGQVLAAVADCRRARCATAGQAGGSGKRAVQWHTLSPQPPFPWLRRAAMAVAASLLLGIGLNVWASKESERAFGRSFSALRRSRRERWKSPRTSKRSPTPRPANGFTAGSPCRASPATCRGGLCEVLRPSKATHQRTTNRLEGFVS